MLHQHTLWTRLTMVLGLLCGLAMILLLLAPTPSAVQALPPRPTPVATITPTPLSLPYTRQGGLIELRVQPAQSSVWTIIQWQDAKGLWHDVEGWQGALNGDSQVWWVAPTDLGKGPFRWQVYQSRGGKLLVESRPFSLPGLNRETVRIEVVLNP